MTLFLVLAANHFFVSINADVTSILNSTGQYFIANESYQYEAQSINCSHPILCYFECNNLRSCNYMTLHTSSINTIINCNAEYVCSGTFNFLLSKHVSIECNNYHSCYGRLHITCPQNNGDCSLTVTADWGAISTELDTTKYIGNHSNININCLASYGCPGIILLANNTVGNNLNLNIHCISEQSCYDAFIDGSYSKLNNVNISCIGLNSCFAANFNLQNSNNINIECNINPKSFNNSIYPIWHGYACSDTYFNLKNSSIISIKCLGGYNNCDGAEINAQIQIN
eukprot:245369_1